MSLPKLNSFLGIELELNVKIFSLVLAITTLITGVWNLDLVNDKSHHFRVHHCISSRLGR